MIWTHTTYGMLNLCACIEAIKEAEGSVLNVGCYVQGNGLMNHCYVIVYTGPQIAVEELT